MVPLITFVIGIFCNILGIGGGEIAHYRMLICMYLCMYVCVYVFIYILTSMFICPLHVVFNQHRGVDGTGKNMIRYEAIEGLSGVSRAINLRRFIP